MGILDGADHTCSAIINGVEHFADDMGMLVDHTISELAALGISSSGAIPWLIQHLIELGEDPVHVLTMLTTRITSMGGTSLVRSKRSHMV